MAETPLKRRLGRPRWVAAPRITVSSTTIAWALLVLAVVIGGGTLRFHGLRWDQPRDGSQPLQMHPDERFISIVNEKLAWPASIGDYFDTARSPLNPYNQPETPSFVYGTFPVFLAKGVATIAGADRFIVSDVARRLCARDGYDSTVVCGRKLTALFDTGTILLVFGVAAVLFGRIAGVGAALLYALSVLPTQLSHFWAVDPYVVFFAVATVLLSILFVRAGIPRDPGPLVRELVARRGGGPLPNPGFGNHGASAGLMVAIGLCVGLGLASKVTAWPILLGPVLAVGTRVALRDFPRLGLRWRGERSAPGGDWTTDLALLCLGMLLAIAVFRVAQPYAFTGPAPWDMSVNPQWRADIEREIDFQNGNVDFPPFVQFAGRSPFLWPLKNLVLFGLGPALGVAAWVSFAFASVLVFRRRELTFVIPLAMVIAVLGFQGPRFVAYMRYFAPIYPFLCVLAAWGLERVARYALEARVAKAMPRLLSRLRPGGDGRIARRWGAVHSRLLRGYARVQPGTSPFRYGLLGVVTLVFAATAFWAFAFQSVYSAEHPRIVASRWVYENIEPGKKLTGEIWDDTIPYAIPNEDASLYPIVNTYPFDSDSEAKVRALVYGRSGQDATVGLAGADYVSLASDRVRDAVNRLEREYPATIRYYELLDSGELGFELVATFRSRPSFLGISIDDSAAEESFTVYDHPEVRIYKKSDRFNADRAFALLMDAHPERAVNLLPRQGRTNGLQFTAAEGEVQQSGGTFSDLFDADGLTSHAPWLWWLLWIEVMAFAAVPWVTWLFRALPDRGFGLSKVCGFAGSGLLTWLAVAWGASHYTTGLIWGVFFALAVGGYGLAFARRRALLADFRASWRSFLAVELVFLAAFFVVLALRYDNPALWHNAQGGEKPVELAYLTAVARSTTLPPYDPWFAGGTMNYYYMGWFLATVPMRALRILPEVGFNLALPTYAGLAASVAFSVVSNLVALSVRTRQATRSNVRAWRGPVLFGACGAVLLIGIGNLDGAHQTIERLQALNQWGFMRDAGDGRDLLHPWNIGIRVLSGGVGIAGGLYQWTFHGATMPPFDWWRPSRVHYPAFDITEFPYWSFLFGDLHAHLMGLPFFGLVIALVMTHVVSSARGLRREAWFLAAALGVAVGLVRTVHTWDFPTATLLAVSGIIASQVLATGRWQRRWWDGFGQLALFSGLMTVLFAPYAQHTEVFESGIVRARETTAVNQYFTHFGLFVAIGLAFLAMRYHEEIRRRDGDPGRNPFLAMVIGRWELLSLFTFTAGLAAFSWQWGLTTVALSAIALLLLFNLLWIEFRSTNRDVPRLLATAMFTGAVGIAGGVDVVQAEYDIVRMNTVFKFSLQAWQLYALASAYASWYLADALCVADGWRLAVRPARRLAAVSVAVVFGGLMFGSAIYLWSGTRARQEAVFVGAPSGTLDGLAYLRAGIYSEDRGTEAPDDDRVIRLADDEPLIRWLRNNVEGSPVIAEAVGPLYHWTGRISWNTGLPAVIGWDWHEVAYRTDYEPLIQERRRDTIRFYTDSSSDFAALYLRKYDVRYVVLGTEELVYGTEAARAKFAAMPQLREVFRSGDYAIYEVQVEGPI